MLGSSYKIATIWGIPIKIHVSLIALLLILAASTGIAGGWNDLVLLLGLEVGVFTSIALHELGHSFVALKKGCRVREITLLFIGGAAQMESIPVRPKDELQMAIAGPLVSVGLGFLSWIVGQRLPLAVGLWPLPFVSGYAIRCNLVQFLGVINWGLAIFNLTPAFPMDGGRIVRALLTPRMGRLRATYVAAQLGKILAVLMAIRGVLDLPQGWLLIVIAFFVHSVAGREYRLVQMQEFARTHAVPPWWPIPPPPDGISRDQVIIGPPPYQRGPRRHVELRQDDDFC